MSSSSEKMLFVTCDLLQHFLSNSALGKNMDFTFKCKDPLKC